MELMDHGVISRRNSKDKTLTKPKAQGSGTLHASGIRFLLWSFILAFVVSPATAAWINFDNCLDPGIINSDPLQLQFVPFFFWATFNTSSPGGHKHHFNATVYGNVSGIATDQDYPGPNSTLWTNPNSTIGKIVNVSESNNRYSTLFAGLDFLSYTPWDENEEFCETLVHGECPLAPNFYVNGSDPAELSAFAVFNDFYSSYSFTSLTAQIKVTSGDASKAELACISAVITPDLGGKISSFLRYLPLTILGSVGFATAFAAVFSPWGTGDLFRWTSNYGRDEDLLRLVTPGIGDCLQYIQFIVLTGSLSLDYPGYYQPVISQASWSALMFNHSFVSHGNGTESLVDGIYVYNGTYGLDRLGQLAGMTSVSDMWACMIIWLLVIIGLTILLSQLWFFLQWGYRHISKVHEEDLRSKNMPFTMGMVIRIIFNYFFLPVVSLSMFQLVVAEESSILTVALATVLLVAIMLFSCWVLNVIRKTKPRAILYDDLPTVLLYGPLYNTYSDEKAAFALIPLLLNFLRGVAIGAVQPSGIAQLVVLAICEIVFILLVNAIRPFESPTSMNAFHTFFSVMRFLAVLLCVAFVPSLQVAEGSKGWIGYVILVIHAFVLVFCFFLNALQTIMEVAARLLGAGDDGTTVVRGGFATKIFGMRQLSRRSPRRSRVQRQSMTSQAAILGPENDTKSIQLESRHRSLSGSSTQLLSRPGGTDSRASVRFDAVGLVRPGHQQTASGSTAYTPTTPRATSAFSFVHGAGSGSPHDGVNGAKSEPSDPFYRPPRNRVSTIEALSPGSRSRGSWASAELAKNRWSAQDGDPEEGPSRSRANSAGQADHLEGSGADTLHPKPDYSTRESDFYYGVRGPALSNQPTRRLRTGPADPTGPVSSATGWFKSLFRGKTKDKGKGFEVVRSGRAPPQLRRPIEEGTSTEDDNAEEQHTPEPYHDEPATQNETQREVDATAQEGEEGDVGMGSLASINRPSSAHSGSDTSSDENESEISEDEDDEDDEDAEDDEDDEDDEPRIRISEVPPFLPPLDTGGELSIPSRVPSRVSKASSKPSKSGSESDIPEVPRKSSKRKSREVNQLVDVSPNPRLSTIGASPPGSPRSGGRLYNPDNPSERHLRPLTTVSNRLPFGSQHSSQRSHTKSSRSSDRAESSASSMNHHDENTNTQQDPQSALGAHAPDTHNDRPSTMGYVQQHRMSDNLHRTSPDEQSLLGSAAEIVTDQFHKDDGHKSHKSS
ncbi:MAG: hypothetical protein M1834_007701 [Cirrosporium novae-zelandiae]|nr:MAG: hypothetical protein M1834_007701 [Cirrosporium novae-zelandiae]